MRVDRRIIKQVIIVCGMVLMGIVFLPNIYADNSMVQGYKKPEVCLKSNIRCILKKQGTTKYWCLKSSIQRNMDTRRTTDPIKKTTRENLGNCAKIIPIREF